MGFSCGIVGLPNVGKSTLFNALTAGRAEVANYPFCTIEPHRGVAVVPDARLEALAERNQPEKVTPTALEFWDIAGLVAGAHQGEGLGNAFLSHLRQVDAIAHVVRAFDDENVSHVYAEVDPVRDVEVINTELALADLASVERRLDKAAKLARVGDKEARAEAALLERLRDELGGGAPARQVRLDGAEKQRARELCLLTDKPVLYIANVDEGGAERPELLERLDELARQQGAELLTLRASLEAEILQIDDPAERQLFYQEMGLGESGLERVVRAGYGLLGLLTFYTTVGPELRAWTIESGTQAVDAAGKIHTDMARGFICAEVLPWQDFEELGDEQAAREAGKLRLEGRSYVVQDGDIVRFRFNV